MAQSLRFLGEFIHRQGGMVAPEPVLEEEISISPQVSKRTQSHALEEVRTVKLDYSIASQGNMSGFAYFEDGKQRTILIGHFPYREYVIPVHYASVGAVILARSEGDLSLWKGDRNPIIKHMLIVPRQYLANTQALDDLPPFIELVDVPAETEDFHDLRRRAVVASKKHRLMAETELIHNWAQVEQSDENLMLIDGTTINLHRETDLYRCAGASKSFRTRYCALQDYQKILGMQEFERSWIFSTHDQDEDLQRGIRERVSWYVRIRSPERHNPEYGLLRLEISPQHRRTATEYANRISRWIISERYPSALPDSRWHNLLYPIKRCEEYLSSIMWSPSRVRHSIGI
jgi:hypothetical protein